MEQRLFRIDARPYRIAVQRAEAGLAEATATVNEARRQWDRVEGLFNQDAISARERDAARSAVELAEAQRHLPFFRLSRVVTHAQLARMVGNSMSVNVVERILCELLPTAGLAVRGCIRDRWVDGGTKWQ